MLTFKSSGVPLATEISRLSVAGLKRFALVLLNTEVTDRTYLVRSSWSRRVCMMKVLSRHPDFVFLYKMVLIHLDQFSLVRKRTVA